jgi:hypothetical protein
MGAQEIIVAIVIILAVAYLVKHAFSKEENPSDPCSTCSTSARKIPGHIKIKKKGE